MPVAAGPQVGVPWQPEVVLPGCPEAVLFPCWECSGCAGKTQLRLVLTQRGWVHVKGCRSRAGMMLLVEEWVMRLKTGTGVELEEWEYAG